MIRPLLVSLCFGRVRNIRANSKAASNSTATSNAQASSDRLEKCEGCFVNKVCTSRAPVGSAHRQGVGDEQACSSHPDCTPVGEDERYHKKQEQRVQGIYSNRGPSERRISSQRWRDPELTHLDRFHDNRKSYQTSQGRTSRLSSCVTEYFD